ncbi:MAG: hypothetical protein ACLQPN_00725 [Bryobacteraceae bacterium]
MFQVKNVGYWSKQELQLTKRKMATQVALSAIEDEAGMVVLDAEESGSGDVAAAFDRIGRAHAEIRAIGSAITACRARRLEAIRADRAAKVAALRKQASEKSSALLSLEAKTGKLLAQLAEMEGCPYQAGGTAKSSLLRAEIADLERKANDSERDDVPVSGEISLEGITETEDVLLAVANHPSQCPSLEKVADWIAACEESASKYRNSSFGDHPLQVSLAWDGDGIDLKRSRIFCKALANKVGHEDSVDYFDIASGTFRANAPTMATRQAQAPVAAPARSGFYRG